MTWATVSFRSCFWGLYRASPGFPGSSAVKEPTCNAGDLNSIPGSGRFPGGGIVYPLQYYRASLVTQTVKNLPAMWETWVQSVGWEDPLKEVMATHSSSCLENPHGQRSLVGCSPWRRKVSDTPERLSTAQQVVYPLQSSSYGGRAPDKNTHFSPSHIFSPLSNSSVV